MLTQFEFERESKRKLELAKQHIAVCLISSFQVIIVIIVIIAHCDASVCLISSFQVIIACWQFSKLQKGAVEQMEHEEKVDEEME